MQNEEISIRLLSKEELPLVQKLAHQIWNEYYPAIIAQDQIDYMLEKMYSLKSLEEQFNSNHQFHFLSIGAIPSGFISISNDSKGNYFIHKLYVQKSLHQKGLGSILFEETIKKFNDCKTISLTVNRKNIQAINFYFRKKFSIEKAEDFDIGNGYVMNDFVMLRIA